MITYSIRKEKGSQRLVGVVCGVPAGVRLAKSYVGHQLIRWIQFETGTAPGIRKDRIVEFSSGLRNGKTDGRRLAIAIAEAFVSQAPFASVAKQRALHSLLQIACNTVIRKWLEDGGVFVGSRVLTSRGPGEIKAQTHIGSLMQASCGAYKITEEADKSPGRILFHHPSRKRSRRPSNEFEIVVSGLTIDPFSASNQTTRLLRQLVSGLKKRRTINVVSATLQSPLLTAMIRRRKNRVNAADHRQPSDIRLRIRLKPGARKRRDSASRTSFSGKSRSKAEVAVPALELSPISVMTESLMPEILVRIVE